MSDLKNELCKNRTLFSLGVEKVMFTEQYFDSKIIMQLSGCLTFTKSDFSNCI